MTATPSPTPSRGGAVRYLLGALVLALMGATAFGLLLLLNPAQAFTNAPTATPNADGVTVVQPPKPLPAFTLTDQHGQPYALDNLRGRYSLVYFGFTHCPDVCPLTLTEFRRVKADLGAEANLNYVLVSVDPERDTPDVLARYLARHDSTFIGLTGPDAALRPLADAFGVYYERRDMPDSALGYMVDHTGSAYLVDPQGRVVRLYPFGTRGSVIALDVSSLLG